MGSSFSLDPAVPMSEAVRRVASAEVDAARALVVNLVNTFYRDRLVLMPTIKDYMDRIQSEAGAAPAEH